MAAEPQRTPLHKTTTSNCSRCTELAHSRQQIVLPDQPEPGYRPLIVVIGEAPGEQEDRKGVGFVGRAGKTLELELSHHGLERRKDYLCANLIRCRPPGNRVPRAEEKEACLPFLDHYLRVIQPRWILTVGNSATQTFAGKGTLQSHIRTLQEQNWRPVLDRLHPRVAKFIEDLGLQVVPVPHTSPLAWNRYNPEGDSWQGIARIQFAILAEKVRQERESLFQGTMSLGVMV